MIAGFWLGLKYLCAMNGDRDRNEARRRQRLLRIGAIAGAALAALCAQFAIYLTCLDPEDERKTTWSLEETNAFVDYLHENRSQVDDSGNFKTATFTAAADAILPLRKNGPRKTRQMCRERWSSFKSIYSSIQNYQATSERLSNSMGGSNINNTGEESVWDDYIAQESSSIEAFQNRLYYDKVQAILSSTGNHAFSTWDLTQQSVIDDDIEETGDSSGNTGSDGGGGQTNVDSNHEATSMGSAAVSGNKRKFSALSTSDDLITARSNKIPRLIGISTESTGKMSSKSSASSPIASAAAETHLQQSKLIAIYGLQASINRLVDILTEALERENQDSSSIERAETTRAIKLLQQSDDDLSQEDKDTVVSLFSKNKAKVTAYLLIHDNDGLRKEWINMILSKPFDLATLCFSSNAAATIYT